MEATAEDLKALVRIQSIDLDIVDLQKRLEALPQRRTILEAREKREVLTEKLSKVEALRTETTKRLARIEDEDASLSKKESGVQAAIEAAGNDFRNVEARTKELDGIARRRSVLAGERDEAKAQLAKVRDLESQVRDALAGLDAVEEEATGSFKAEGGRLKAGIAKAQSMRSELLGNVDHEVASLYERTSKLFDTVFIGRLDNGTCSVCRTTLDPGRVIRLKGEAPLSTCPACKRLLVIGE